MFAITLTFLFSTPGMWVSVPGFPIPVTSAGGAFVIKDVFLLLTTASPPRTSVGRPERAFRRREPAPEATSQAPPRVARDA